MSEFCFRLCTAKNQADNYKRENQDLQAIIMELRKENSNLRKQVSDNQNQSGNFEVQAQAEAMNSQYLERDIQTLRDEKRTIQDAYNELAVNFRNLLNLMEQQQNSQSVQNSESSQKLGKSSTLNRFEKAAETHGVPVPVSTNGNGDYSDIPVRDTGFIISLTDLNDRQTQSLDPSLLNTQSPGVPAEPQPQIDEVEQPVERPYLQGDDSC